MALPVGIETGIVTFGSAVSFGGRTTAAKINVIPSARLVYDPDDAGDGIPVLNFVETAEAGDGQPGQLMLPLCDQPGFKATQNGVLVWITDWSYRATLTWTDPQTRATDSVTKVFQLLSGQAVIDFDRLPDTVGVFPVSAPIVGVTAFLGKTGNIIASDLDELNLGGSTTVDELTDAGATGKQVAKASTPTVARAVLGVQSAAEAGTAYAPQSVVAVLNNKPSLYYGSLGGIPLIMSPESPMATVIPYYMNDLAYNNKRGGETRIFVDDVLTVKADVDVLYDSTSAAVSINPIAGVSEVRYEVDCWKIFTYGTKVGFAVNESWRATKYKIEVFDIATSAWKVVADIAATQAGEVVYNVTGNSNKGFNKIRYTFSNFANATTFRMGSLFVLGYSSTLGSSLFVTKNGDTVFGAIKGVNPIADADLTRKDYVDGKITALTQLLNVGVSFPVAETSAVNFTLSLPTTPTQAVMRMVEIKATAAITVTIPAEVKLTTGLAKTLAIPSGKTGFIDMRYSPTSSLWYLLAATVEV